MKHPKIPRIVWRNGWPSYRFTIDGEELWIGLGVQDPDAVRQTAEALTKTIQVERMRARLERAGVRADLEADNRVLDRYPLLKQKLAGLRQREDVPTVGEVIEAFEADAKLREISHAGVRAYVSYFRKILRDVLKLADNDAVDAQRVSVLKPELLHDYQALAIGAAKANGPAAIATARRTSFSAVNQMQAIFSEAALQGAKMRELRLLERFPALQKFRDFKPEGSTKKVRAPVDDLTLARLKSGIDDLWFTAPARWLALALCGNLGLRRGSANMTRWDWCRRVDGKWKIYLLDTDEATPKGNELSVVIPDDLWADMNEVRQTGDYIVPGDTLQARDQVFQENVEWLRSLGLDVDKPNHELRAIYAQAMKRAHGTVAAQEALGHSDRGTTTLYTGRGTDKAVRPF